MQKRITIFILFILMAGFMNAQRPNINQFVDLTGTFSSSQGSVAASYVHNWKIGKHKKWELGIGGRWTTYAGTKKDFITAGPASYTRTFTFPFLIFFAGQKEENFDTLTVQRPLTHSVNITFNAGYNLNPKWYLGFNIDVIGFTFGRESSAVFTGINANTGEQSMNTEPAAKPAAFNLLLTGDHDIGSLNSEFFVKYAIGKSWHLKAVYQFLFIEYETDLVKQEIPDGPVNVRFRNKANNFGLGVSYKFK